MKSEYFLAGTRSYFRTSLIQIKWYFILNLYCLYTFRTTDVDKKYSFINSHSRWINLIITSLKRTNANSPSDNLYVIYQTQGRDLPIASIKWFPLFSLHELLTNLSKCMSKWSSPQSYFLIFIISIFNPVIPCCLCFLTLHPNIIQKELNLHLIWICCDSVLCIVF